MTVRILHGHVLDKLAELEDESVHCIVTSPPYWGLRSYGTEPQVWGGDPACEHEWGERIAVKATVYNGTKTKRGNAGEWPQWNNGDRINAQVQQGSFCRHCGAWRGELGLEPDYRLYVEHLVAVFDALWRVLRNDGTAWLNLGDTYASGGGTGAQGTRGQRFGRTHTQEFLGTNRAQREAGLKPKDLVGIPWRVAFALQDRGWWLRKDNIVCLSGGTRVYARTQKGEMPMTIKDMVRLDPATVQLWNGDNWTQAVDWTLSARPEKTYELELRSGERIGCTAGHRWPIKGIGDAKHHTLQTRELKVDDIIATCLLPAPQSPITPRGLRSEDIGWLVGTFLADGSWLKDRTAFSISSNANEEARFAKLRELAAAYHGSFFVHFVKNTNAAMAIVHSRILAAIIETYISGSNSSGKHLSVKNWARSNAYLASVVNGYLEGDGHQRKPGQWTIGFTQNDELAFDLRTACARLGYKLRLRRHLHNSQWGDYPGWRGQLITENSGHWNCKEDSQIVAIRESRARQFWDIEVADEPHLFSLASGILTHNSKRNPKPESVNDRTTTAHEYVFHLTKAERYWYDADAIAEPAVQGERYHGNYEHRPGMPPGRNGRDDQDNITKDRNRRSVWTVNTSPTPEAHFATMPETVVEICILAGCPVGGTVLDPFLGSGTTARVADRLGRDCIGIDLQPNYVKMAERRTREPGLALAMPAR